MGHEIDEKETKVRNREDKRLGRGRMDDKRDDRERERVTIEIRAINSGKR